MCASSSDINKKRWELRHGAEHDSTEQHGNGYLVWTLGVGMADGPRALPLCTDGGSWYGWLECDGGVEI